VGLHTASWATMRSAHHVMVHLLADGQEDLARRFADPSAAKFGPATRWRRGAFDLPVLEDVLAWLALVPVSRMPVGDHALIVGRVVEAGHVAGEPLVHHNGAFARLTAA
jgi:flavin reductase (DIM6/NTAB) family NADH-FMN oxidoreductase RutF